MRYRKLNTSPNTIEDKDVLKMYLVTPPVKKIDLVWPLGLSVTARNLKGVTVKDALDAIYKQFKKKARLSARFSVALHASSLLTVPFRPMMNWISPTLLASSGTRRSAGHASSSIRPRTAHPQHPARSPRRRRTRHRYLMHPTHHNGQVWLSSPLFFSFNGFFYPFAKGQSTSVSRLASLHVVSWAGSRCRSKDGWCLNLLCNTILWICCARISSFLFFTICMSLPHRFLANAGVSRCMWVYASVAGPT